MAILNTNGINAIDISLPFPMTTSVVNGVLSVVITGGVIPDGSFIIDDGNFTGTTTSDFFDDGVF